MKKTLPVVFVLIYLVQSKWIKEKLLEELEDVTAELVATEVKREITNAAGKPELVNEDISKLSPSEFFPLENCDPDKFECDEVLTEQQKEVVQETLKEEAETGKIVSFKQAEAHLQGRRRDFGNSFKRWPNGKVIIDFPENRKYDRYGSDTPQWIALKRAMRTWTEKTMNADGTYCISFRERKTETSGYLTVRFVEKGCAASLGFDEHQAELDYGPKCQHQNTMEHELGHVLGLFHEQARPDRDEYVKVLLGNVKERARGQFKKYDTSSSDTGASSYNLPYDYSSIMQYPFTAFSNGAKPNIEANWVRGKDGTEYLPMKQTMVPLRTDLLKQPGPYVRISDMDVKAVRAHYGCGSSSSKSSHKARSQAKTETGGTKKCVNNKNECDSYASNGRCTGSWKQWMETNCCKACAVKKKAAPTTTTCEDTEKIDCSAYEQAGHCTGSYASWMKKKCPKACNYCCKDKSERCAEYTFKGYCSTYASYMKKKCKASCYSLNNNCKDVKEQCAGWKQQGSCETHKDYMMRNCKLSCGWCNLPGYC